MDTLTPNELAELLLAALAEETESLGHSNYFVSMDDIAARLGIEDHNRVIEACHLLEDNSYILLAFDHLTSLSAFMTPEGERCVSEGGQTGIIGEYQRYRAARALNSPGSGDPAPGPVPVSSFQPPPVSPSCAPEETQTPPAGEGGRHLLASMELLIRNDLSLSETSRKDLLTDMRTLELQLSRSLVNRSVIEAISAELRTMPTLAPLVDLLLSMKETK